MPSGLIEPSAKLDLRIDTPAGFGALAMMVRPPPVTAPATIAYLNSAAPPLDQRGQIGQRRIVGNRRQANGQIKQERRLDTDQRRLQPPLLQAAKHDQTGQKEGDQQAFAQDQTILIALVGFGIAEEEQEQAHEDCRVVGEQDNCDEKGEVVEKVCRTARAKTMAATSSGALTASMG